MNLSANEKTVTKTQITIHEYLDSGLEISPRELGYADAEVAMIEHAMRSVDLIAFAMQRKTISAWDMLNLIIERGATQDWAKMRMHERFIERCKVADEGGLCLEVSNATRQALQEIITEYAEEDNLHMVGDLDEALEYYFNNASEWVD